MLYNIDYKLYLLLYYNGHVIDYQQKQYTGLAKCRNVVVAFLFSTSILLQHKAMF